eukprot:11209784-Lingulodinium_polyedra.AAC.1
MARVWASGGRIVRVLHDYWPSPPTANKDAIPVPNVFALPGGIVPALQSMMRYKSASNAQMQRWA